MQKMKQEWANGHTTETICCQYKAKVIQASLGYSWKKLKYFIEAHFLFQMLCMMYKHSNQMQVRT
jgi:hypothetical protein